MGQPDWLCNCDRCAEKLKKRKACKYSVRSGSVQEEVGLRGARTAANKVQPDISIAVDVGIAGDTPGVTDKEAQGKMGDGPQIILYDASMVSHKGLRDLVTNIADELGIPYQFDAIPGGDDAGATHLAGGRGTFAGDHNCNPLYSHACGHSSSR